MTDAERRKIFTLIPRGQPVDSSIAFVLPDSFSDPDRVAARERNRGGFARADGNAYYSGEADQKLRSPLLAAALRS